jgi:hypothetical protein
MGREVELYALTQRRAEVGEVAEAELLIGDDEQVPIVLAAKPVGAPA